MHPHLQQARDRSGGIIGVQGGEDKMAGERSLDRDLCGLEVADFPHHDDIGILAHNGAQAVGKGEPDLRFYLDLVDAAQLILDRILDSDDFLSRIVDFLQGAVERRGLAAPGRSGDQDHPMRLGNHFAEVPENSRGKAEGLKIGKNLRAF